MRRIIAGLILTLWALPVFADEISVDSAWARATPPGARTAAIYLTLSNSGDKDQLIEVSTPAASEAQLHTHVHEAGMMRMERVDAVDIPAGGSAVLKPHGDHIMLIGLIGPLKPGAMVDLQLVFREHPSMALQVPVQDARR